MKLFRHLDERVDTPRGRGTLWQVFRNLAGVVLEHQDDPRHPKVSFFRPEEIRPVRRSHSASV